MRKKVKKIGDLTNERVTWTRKPFVHVQENKKHYDRVRDKKEVERGADK